MSECGRQQADAHDPTGEPKPEEEHMGKGKMVRVETIYFPLLFRKWQEAFPPKSQVKNEDDPTETRGVQFEF